MRFIERIVSLPSALENRLDRKLLVYNPELWRRGYAKILSELLLASITLLSVAMALLVPVIKSKLYDNYLDTLPFIAIYLFITAVFPFLCLGRLFYLVFGGNEKMFQREFKEIYYTKYSYTKNNDTQVL
ncbi:MAG: hypothetical protein AAFY76_01915, partial [Cyanobacteria bacterium J06649_11]